MHTILFIACSGILHPCYFFINLVLLFDEYPFYLKNNSIIGKQNQEKTDYQLMKKLHHPYEKYRQ